MAENIFTIAAHAKQHGTHQLGYSEFMTWLQEEPASTLQLLRHPPPKKTPSLKVSSSPTTVKHPMRHAGAARFVTSRLPYIPHFESKRRPRGSGAPFAGAAALRRHSEPTSQNAVWPRTHWLRARWATQRHSCIPSWAPRLAKRGPFPTTHRCKPIDRRAEAPRALRQQHERPESDPPRRQWSRPSVQLALRVGGRQRLLRFRQLELLRRAKVLVGAPSHRLKRSPDTASGTPRPKSPPCRPHRQERPETLPCRLLAAAEPKQLASRCKLTWWCSLRQKEASGYWGFGAV